MIKIQTYEDLDVYQRAYRIALSVHSLTMKYPTPDKMELGGQMRRASKLIAANIAEGFARRKFKKEYLRYLRMARASCDEMRVHLKFSLDLKYLSEKDHQSYWEDYTILGKQLSSLINAWLKF